MWRRPQTHVWFNRTDKPLTAAYDRTTMITLGFRQKMLMETTSLAQTGAWLMLFTSTGAKNTPMKRFWELDPLHTPVLIYIILLYQGCSKYHQMFSPKTLIPALSSGSGIPDYHAEWLRVSQSTAVLHPIEDPLTVCLNTEARARLQTPHTPPLWLQKPTATEDRQTGHVLQWSYHGNVNIKQNCTSSLQYTSLVLLWTIHQYMLFQRKLNVCHWSERSPQKQLFFLTPITVSLVKDPVSLRNMSRSRRKLLKL